MVETLIANKNANPHPMGNTPNSAWIKMNQTPLKILKSHLLKNEVPGNHLRCVCISDTHGKHKKLCIPKGDILFHTGDMTAFGCDSEVYQFNTFLGTLPHTYKIIIAGNHDMCLDPEFPVAGTKVTPSLLSNAIYLQDSAVDIEGIKVYGTPWIPVYGAWAFSKNRGKSLLEKWNAIPNGVDILLTHSPPVGHGDLTKHGDHAGCVDLLYEVQQRIKPQFHVFGHIHEGYGVTSDGYTTFINCSVCDVSYNVVNSPIVFDISKPGAST